MKSVIVIIFDKPSNSSLLFTCINDDVNYRLILCSCAHALIIIWTWGFCATAERRGLCHRKNRLLVTRFRDDYTSTKSCAEVWSLNNDCDFNHDDFIFQFWWSTIFFQRRVGADTTLLEWWCIWYIASFCNGFYLLAARLHGNKISQLGNSRHAEHWALWLNVKLDPEPSYVHSWTKEKRRSYEMWVWCASILIRSLIV